MKASRISKIINFNLISYVAYEKCYISDITKKY